jgi:hypothetical protein
MIPWQYDATLDPALRGRLVRVYRNLRRGCYSVQIRDGGEWRVAAHTTRLDLRDARFEVSEKGRQRVVRERRKNVHAWIIGTVDRGPEVWDMAELVGYNPYNAPTFVTAAGRPVRTAWWCRLDPDGVQAVKVNES